MPSDNDDEVGSAPTVAADPSEPSRTPSQQDLHDDVKGALFGSSAAAASAKETGTVFAGRYRLLGLLGRGGMGEVYRAHDLVLGEDVALKFLPRRYARSKSLMERFLNEARVARQVTHAHVCRVHDIGEAEGKPFLSMEFIDGEDLASLLTRIGRLPREKAYELAQQLCGGLAALHEQGVLHRDLKPSNVMIDGRGQLKILDFGLAALAEELRTDELRDGTPAYMAPEQAEGKSVDERSDIYALGLVIFELLTGRHAFASETSTGGPPTLDRSRTPAGPSRHVRGLPSELDEILKACLDPNPTARPNSVLEVAVALPGGDPVAAAIAAGRAPSVDAIASLGRVGYVAPWIAYACAAFVAVSIVLFAALAPSVTVLGESDPPLTPEVLLDRATSALADAGIAAPDADSWTSLSFDDGLLQAREGEPRPTIDADGPSVLLLYHRRSSGALVSASPIMSYYDPPLLRPGELRVTLDGRGLLRALEVLPADELPSPAPPHDWTPLLEAAGVDRSALSDVKPRFTPPVESDEHVAWEGTIVVTDTPVRIEAAALGGQVVYFEVFVPWHQRVQPKEDPPTIGGLEYLSAGLFAAVLLLIAWLARRSIKRGDADLRGAFRVGAAAAVLHGLVLAAWGHHGNLTVEGNLAVKVLRDSVFIGGISIVLYVIVEPYGRRVLPGAMVAWTRLVTARWRDPLVAREVLVAVTAGSALVWLTRLQFLTIPDRVPAGVHNLDVLLGTRYVVGGLAVLMQDAILSILSLVLLFLVLRVALRGTKRTVVVFLSLMLLLSRDVADLGPSALDVALQIGIPLAIGGAVVFLLVRFGVLATVVTQVTANVFFAFPLTTDLNAWYGATGLVSLACVAALVLFGLRCVRPGPAPGSAGAASSTRA